MEFRYYLIFGTVIVVLQLFLYSLARTLGWLFNWSPKTRKRASWIIFLGVNGLFASHLMGVWMIFRPLASVLVALLFAFLLSFLTACLYPFVKNKPKANKMLRMAYPLAYLGLAGLAVYNAYVPTVVRYSVQIDKPLDQPLRIGMASDLHLGKLFGGKQLDQLAEIFNQEKVDIILLPGDIMDDNTNAYVAENMRPHLAKLQAPLGVYATLGNHDFFGSQMQIVEEIRQAGIFPLWDQAVEINEKFTIVGRNDDTFHFRPDTEKLLEQVDTTKPVFLLDHQPSQIMAHSALPIDLQMSGHTHRGQISPANLLTKWLYRLDYGYEKIGNGHFVVSSGYGFWGIPMRLGSQSEVVIIDVKGK